MRNLVRFVTRKSRGGIAVRDEIVEGEIVVAGRATDCGIRLPDPRVMLRHAEFTLRGGDLYVSAAPGADLRVNDSLTQVTKVDVGGKVRIGPFEIEVQETTPDFGFTIAVELVQALGDDLEKLVARSKIHITRIGLTMRWWVWLMTGAVVAGTFAVPFIFNLLVGPPPTQMMLTPGKDHYIPSPTGVWTSGGVSAAHKFFGDSCETCHEKPFIQVRDQACLTCHGEIENHAQAVTFPFADLTDSTCQSCHKEHQGNATITLSNESFCADCHGDMGSKTDKSKLSNVTDFGSNHPEFRPTVVTDPGQRTTDRSRTIDATPPPREASGLKFPHDRHLRRTGIKDPVRGNVVLDCVNCHVPTETGETMRTVSFDRHCHSCHVLKFDTFAPDRELMHGKPEEVFKQIYDVYNAMAMRGGYEEPAAPPLLRRRPGTELAPVERRQASDWAVAKAEDILAGYFGRGLCEECHTTVDVKPAAAGANSGRKWTVNPPMVATLWMPKARFTHARHTDVKCAECHAARESVTSNDVLLPSIKVCQACHGGEKAADRVPSTCVDCHVFHRKDMGPMRSPQKLADTGGMHAHGMATAGILPRWETR